MAEEIDIDTLTTDQQVDILLQELPLPVQRFLTSPERNAVSLSLSQKYQLHADTATLFDRAYVFMLLGVYTPEEFVKELRDGGLPEATIRGIATDVNEMVFKKLRAEERTGVPVPPPAPPKAQVPVMGIEIKQAVPPNLPGQTAPAASAPPPIYMNPTPQPIPAAAPPQPIPARTMQSDVEHLTQTYQAVAAGQPFQQPTYQAPPPAPAPIAPPPSPAPSYPPPAMASVRLTPVDRPRIPNAPIVKEFGSDPYREPIE